MEASRIPGHSLRRDEYDDDENLLPGLLLRALALSGEVYEEVSAEMFLERTFAWLKNGYPAVSVGVQLKLGDYWHVLRVAISGCNRGTPL